MNPLLYLFLTAALPLICAGAVLAIMWNAQTFQSERVVGHSLLFWAVTFAAGFLIAEAFFALALFFICTTLLLSIRLLWQDNDDGGEEDFWDFYPRNPLDGMRKKSKDTLFR